MKFIICYVHRLADQVQIGELHIEMDTWAEMGRWVEDFQACSSEDSTFQVTSVRLGETVQSSARA